MKNRLFLFLCITTMLWTSLTACNIVQGSGHLVRQEREVSAFKQVALSDIGEVIITQGTTNALSIEAEDNVLPLIEARVQNQVLVIGLKDNVALQTDQPVRFFVQMVEVAGLVASDSGKISAQSIESDQLTLSVGDSGAIVIEQLTTDVLDVTISGSGQVTLAGYADQQTVNVEDSGKYDTADLESTTANITLSGSAEGHVRVNDQLAASLDDSSVLSYFDDPVIEIRTSGSATATQLSDH